MNQPSQPPVNVITFEILGAVPEGYLWSESKWPERVRFSGSHTYIAYAMFNALLESDDLNVEVVTDGHDPDLVINFAQDSDEFRLCRCGQTMTAEVQESRRHSYACIIGGGCGRVVLINSSTGVETWWRKEIDFY